MSRGLGRDLQKEAFNGGENQLVSGPVLIKFAHARFDGLMVDVLLSSSDNTNRNGQLSTSVTNKQKKNIKKK